MQVLRCYRINYSGAFVHGKILIVAVEQNVGMVLSDVTVHFWMQFCLVLWQCWLGHGKGGRGLKLCIISKGALPSSIIWAMMIVCRIRGKIIRTVLCCVVFNSCAQWYAQTYEQFLKLSVGLGLGLVFVHLFRLSILCVFLVWLMTIFYCVQLLLF